jgi:hypothetical protein
MTLTRLLEIDSRLVKPDEFVSVALAERVWREHGCPTGVRELTDLLETALSECRQGGIRYAPILLQRKKALHRGTWAPQADRVAALNRGTTQRDTDGAGCSNCRGTGVMIVLGGKGGTLCPCEVWKKRSITN